MRCDPILSCIYIVRYRDARGSLACDGLFHRLVRFETFFHNRLQIFPDRLSQLVYFVFGDVRAGSVEVNSYQYRVLMFSERGNKGQEKAQRDSRIALAIPHDRSASNPIAPRHMSDEPLGCSFSLGDLFVVQDRSL